MGNPKVDWMAARMAAKKVARTVACSAGLKAENLDKQWVGSMVALTAAMMAVKKVDRTVASTAVSWAAERAAWWALHLAGHWAVRSVSPMVGSWAGHSAV